MGRHGNDGRRRHDPAESPGTTAIGHESSSFSLLKFTQVLVA
jgi:hypothetical protein